MDSVHDRRHPGRVVEPRADLADRPVGLGREQDGDEGRRQAQRSVDHPQPGRDRHEPHRHRRHQVQRRRGQERHPQHRAGRSPVRLPDAGHLVDLPARATEQPQRRQAGDDVEHVTRQPLPRRPLPRRAGPRRPPDERREHRQQRQRQDHHQRRRRVRHHQPDQHERRQHHGEDQRGQVRGEPRPQVVDPAGGELAPPPPARVAPLGVGVAGVEQLLPQRFDDAVRGPGRDPRRHRRDQRPHDERRRQRGQRGARRRRVLHQAGDEQPGRHQRGGVGHRPDDTERHLRHEPRQGRAGQAQQARVDRAGAHAAPTSSMRGTPPRSVSSRPLATRRRNTQYENAW